MKQGQVVEVSEVGSFEGIHLELRAVSPLFAMQVEVALVGEGVFINCSPTFFSVPRLALHDPVEDLANPTMNSADGGAVAILRCRRLEDCRLITATIVSI